MSSALAVVASMRRGYGMAISSASQRPSSKLLYPKNGVFSTTTTTTTKGNNIGIMNITKPPRQKVTPSERAILRKERRERAKRALLTQNQNQGGNNTSIPSSVRRPLDARWIFGLGLGLPTGIIAWGIYDEQSPPAMISKYIGLTKGVEYIRDEFSKPIHDKLLPDWSQMPNVPQDIPVPHTLVLDLENTLVSSTWDRRYGWRHAKRPGVDKFLQAMAEYYEIVLFSASYEGLASPVVDSLDPSGCIMHRLYREATWNKRGVPVKDLDRLNRNVQRMIVLDDDPNALQLHPHNVIHVRPYTDPTDRKDRTLSRITPLLIEIAREGYNNIPEVLQTFESNDADSMADEFEHRVENARLHRNRLACRGLGALAMRSHLEDDNNGLPKPELPPEPEVFRGQQQPQQLTAKDVVGAGAGVTTSEQNGMVGWLNRRQKEQQDQQQRKMEKWNEVMMKKHLEKKRKADEKEAAKIAASATQMA